MSTVLMVPIHLDALYLQEDQIVAEPMAHFARLPYYNGIRDVNPNVANISEEILSKPFQYLNLQLKAGMHLHWALPDALTQGQHRTEQRESTTHFPTVPNRWLITRSAHNLAGEPLLDQKWVIESDYLYPDGEGQTSGSVAYPVQPNPAQGHYRPFRYLGRRIPFEHWQPQDPEAEYLDRLTAIGYGEPTFAAFYPNCRSVFGFFDDANSLINVNAVQYDLLGWYADPAQDHFSQFVGSLDANLSPEARLQSISEHFRWAVDRPDNPVVPDQMLCYARLIFDPDPNDIENPRKSKTDTIVTVANSSTEALSAHLAHRLNPEQAAEIEDQLEAIQFATRLEQRQLDVGHKFEEARHEKGFVAVAGGTLWTVRAESSQTVKASERDARAEAQITLPNPVAHQLNQVNILQKAYDRAWQEIESLRKRLFSDWYKYMISAYPPLDSREDYPDVDQVRHFIEQADLRPLQRKITQTGQLLLQFDQANAVVGTTTQNASETAIATQLAQAMNILLQSLAAQNQEAQVQAAKLTYQLRPAAAARYWQPREPVVLLTGEGMAPSERHGQDGRLREDGLLDCQIIELAADGSLHSQFKEQIETIQAKVEAISGTPEQIGFDTWRHQPWHPFLLAWRAEVLPVQNRSNAAPASKKHPNSEGYAPDFISDNYWLPEVSNLDIHQTSVELIPKEGKGATTRGANIYSGVTILTPQAEILLKEHIETYLEKQLLDAYYQAQNIAADAQNDTYFKEHQNDILTWYKTTYCQSETSDPICNIIAAYEELIAPQFYGLSQSLGGFNEALLMHHQTLQLPVEDPLGFADYQPFTAAVREAVQDQTISAPVPGNDFNPIRSGELEITHLELIDTFGQVKSIYAKEQPTALITVAHTMRSTQHQGKAWLPPRLVQPARLNFRWLSADLGESEMNDHPATTPICGWLLTNRLDSSLMIFDGQGRALGAINQEGRWDPPPGNDQPHAVNDIDNEHLKQLVTYLLQRGPGFQQHFISTIDSAVENIDPENFAQHQSRAFLMGRPVALVRANLNLELLEVPAVHHAWQSFIKDMGRHTRETDDFTKVAFPIRLGEYRQFNDGLVGYWLEGADGYQDNTFYSPQSTTVADELIKTHADNPLHFLQAIDDAPHTLTILMDPRGSVHATSGILPTKGIDLPPDQYLAALQAIEITFLSTPILTDRNKIKLALPQEPGFSWSWLQRDRLGWREISTSGLVTRQMFADTFEQPAALWQELVSKNWLQEADDQAAWVVPKDQRPDQTLSAEFQSALPAIEDIFDRAHIGPTSALAQFTGLQEIREGWLKLKKEAVIQEKQKQPVNGNAQKIADRTERRKNLREANQ